MGLDHKGILVILSSKFYGKDKVFTSISKLF